VLPGRPRQRWRIEARPAAVAVLLAERGGVAHVPLIVRGADAPAHPGQIALPGGGIEPDDADAAAAARREAFEELGVPPARVDVLGLLDDVPTPTGYVITPVVARLDAAGLAYTPDPREVAGWFEAPLALFADRGAAVDLGEREYRGVRYRLRGYRYGEHTIWGATAKVLESVCELLA